MVKQTRDQILTGLSIIGLFASCIGRKKRLEYRSAPKSLRHLHHLRGELQFNQRFCGQFSLAPNAFAAIGAYTSALLTMSPAEKQISFIIEPLIWPLNVISVPFWVSLLAAGLVTAFSHS